MKTIQKKTKIIQYLLVVALLSLNGFGVEDARGYSYLGSVNGLIGGGQYTASSQAPTGIYFSYGYGGSGGVYVFDDIVITGGGEITLLQEDDPQFSDIANALRYGVPQGDSFYVGLGFSPSPPFHRISSYYYALPIPISADSIIESLVLTIGDFSISSTPAPGEETLWEITEADYSIAAYGTNNPVPVPATMLLLATGLAGLAGAKIRRKKK